MGVATDREDWENAREDSATIPSNVILVISLATVDAHVFRSWNGVAADQAFSDESNSNTETIEKK